MIVYRLDLETPSTPKPVPEGACIIVSGIGGVLKNFAIWVRNWGWKEAIKAALKVLSRRRVLFHCVVNGKTVVQSGWANFGFCRYYPVEKNAVVLGTLYTRPEYRSRGYATAAKGQVIKYLYHRGFTRFYADTTPANLPAQRTIEKLGFQRIA